MVASITISDSCGAPSSRFAATRRTFASSSIRFVWVCSRPAVSAMTTSMPRDSAAAIASKTTAPGSPPGTPADDLHAGALGPRLELLDRGSAVGVGRRDDHREAQLVAQVPGELADRGRLAGAVDADDHHHRRPGAEVDAAVVAAATSASSSTRRSRTPRRPPPSPPRPRSRGARRPRRSSARRRRRGSAPPPAAPRPRRRAVEQARAELRLERLAALREALAQPPEKPPPGLGSGCLLIGRGRRGRRSPSSKASRQLLAIAPQVTSWR